MSAPTKKRLSVEEIVDEIHELARNGEGAAQRWALQQLSAGNASLTIPPPMTDEEVIDRMARLNRGCGFELAKRGFARAFPAGTPVGWTVARAKGVDYLPTTLKEMYEMFPDAPMEPLTGAPPGYPEKSMKLVKKRWVAEYAAALREAKKAHADSEEQSSEV